MHIRLKRVGLFWPLLCVVNSQRAYVSICLWGVGVNDVHGKIDLLKQPGFFIQPPRIQMNYNNYSPHFHIPPGGGSPIKF